MEAMIKVIIFLTLGLLVVFVLINIGRGGVIDPIKSFASIFSTEKRGDELTPTDYQRMIKGYKDSGEQINAWQLCNRYRDSMIDSYNSWQEETKKKNSEVYCPT